jgi:effector-binding domain-containing protein
MITGPRFEDRPEQGYVGIRTLAALDELPTVIPQLIGEVFAWLEARGVAPAGAPFIRYHVIDMARRLDVEIGIPVVSAVSGDGRVRAGVLPGGRYATLVFTGPPEGLMGANKALLDWGKEQGVAWDRWDTEQGDAFGSRFEAYLTDPAEQPDRSKWETEVAIRLAA